MSSFGCCIWWLLLGALLGWLLNYWLCKRCKSKAKETVTHYSPPPAPAAKATPTPAATAAPVMKAPTPAKKATPAKPKAAPAKKAPAKAKPTKKAPAKPKTTAKPKATTKPKTTVKKIAIDLAAAKAAGISIKNIDDLTVIEGVGPKINELFKDNGLKTFAQVATATVSQMRAILDKGGPRYRIANPGTWAKQAKLATNNKWKELKKLQDDLSGGKKK